VEKPEREFLIGLDETGKGEVLGHSVLAGVLVPKSLLEKVSDVLGTADTKKKKSTKYWDDLYLELDPLEVAGVKKVTEKIPPWHVDRYNTNKIMDLVYQRIISSLTQNLNLGDCRIIIDDYGIGRNLSEYLESLHKSDCDVKVESKADDNYVECKLASVIAKRERTKVMEAIDKQFSIPSFPIGSGNAGDEKTLSWLKEYWRQKREWPWFVKKSFSTIREIDGRKEKTKKIDPPIRHELLSQESISLFREGKLSVSSLTIGCPSCGESMRSCKIAPDNTLSRYVGRCINCDAIIDDLNMTLLYYCGYVVLDSNVIFEKILEKDLEKGKFFEGFTFLLHPSVHKECDSENGRKALEAIARFSSIGRIHLQEIIPPHQNEDVDEAIVESAKKYNAIVYSRDKRMHAIAVSKNVFFLK
jgi:ribonuclease HII